jgi:hypothetical protein
MLVGSKTSTGRGPGRQGLAVPAGVALIFVGLPECAPDHLCHFDIVGVEALIHRPDVGHLRGCQGKGLRGCAAWNRETGVYQRCERYKPDGAAILFHLRSSTLGGWCRTPWSIWMFPEENFLPVFEHAADVLAKHCELRRRKGFSKGVDRSPPPHENV